MNHIIMNKQIPTIIILIPNSLMGYGLRSILERQFPFAAFKVMEEFEQVAGYAPEDIFHIFAAANIIVEHSDFFEQRHNKTIALTFGSPNAQLLKEYPQINVSASAEQIEQSITELHKSAHGRPMMMRGEEKSAEVLSPREIEVLKLIVDGRMNKEIADILNISTTTVITHRKNIIEKVGVKSVAGLTIYAVMKRFIEI